MEREEMPCCAAQEQSDHSAKLQHVKFAVSELQKEQLFLQEYTALLGFFPPSGYKICSWAPRQQSAAKAKPYSGEMLSWQESFQRVL